MPAQIHYYVWYQVTADPAQTRAAIDAMMAELARKTGNGGRLLVRRDDETTWMEVYDDIVDAGLFEREIAAAVLRHGIDRIAKSRHVEVFASAG